MPDIPRPVRRELRQEANFGCAICGCPLVDMHHIIPRSEKEHNDPDHMVALCPTHHRLAGPQAERITRDQLYKAKQNPHNSDIVDHDFYFESQTPAIEFGGGQFRLVDRDEMTLLCVHGEDIINISYRDGLLRFTTNLYNEDNETVAELNESEWTAYTDQLWDLTYQTEDNHFKIWHEKRNIGVEVNYDSDSDYISIRGNFFKDGLMIRATPSKIVTNGNNIISGLNVTDCPTAIHVGMEIEESYKNKDIIIKDMAPNIVDIERPSSIENKSFEDCHIIGPAVVYLDNVSLIQPTLDCATNLDSILWLVEEGEIVEGVILLNQCRFENCRFTGIGFAVNQETIQSMKESVQQA